MPHASLAAVDEQNLETFGKAHAPGEEGHDVSPGGQVAGGRKKPQGIPARGPLEVLVRLCPPDNRRRDEDNFAGKALFDALTKAGVWNDDSQIRRKVVEWGEVVKGGAVNVEIRNLVA